MEVVLSPFQRYREEKRLLHNNKSTLVDAPSSFHILNTELERDVNYLRTQFETIADRINYKREVLLPKWKPKAEQYLNDGKIYQNIIFVYCIIWLFDTEQYDQAIEWSIIATEQNQKTPNNFNSSIPAFVADTILEWAEKTSANGHSIEPYFSQVFELIKNKWRLHEEICAKWYKFAGYYLLKNEDGTPSATAIDDIQILEQAKELLTKAHKFHEKIGVRTMISNIESRINALTK